MSLVGDVFVEFFSVFVPGRYCSSIGDFGLSHRDAEKAIKKAMNVELWCSRMSRALEEANAVQGSGVPWCSTADGGKLEVKT